MAALEGEWVLSGEDACTADRMLGAPPRGSWHEMFPALDQGIKACADNMSLEILTSRFPHLQHLSGYCANAQMEDQQHTPARQSSVQVPRWTDGWQVIYALRWLACAVSCEYSQQRVYAGRPGTSSSINRRG